MTQNKFWLVWNAQGGHPKYQHGTQELATQEARKLASKNPENEFYVLQATHSFKADVNVVETDLSEPIDPQSTIPVHGTEYERQRL